ncbi:MAG: N-acetylmuramoyl-L-alanine amidase [Bacteroidales bacterium]|nr:N-acetylmuramoyl-L-alanine amidase [Bacteroidales bacterium]
MREINDIIIHCTATRRGRNHTVDQVRQWHLARGFDDIGYHYLIYTDGTLHLGRPVEQVGAHAYGHNQHSIGICYVGGLDRLGRPANTLNAAQQRTLVTLVKTLLSIFPQAQLHGHNDYSDKQCPCFDVAEWWNKNNV